MITVLEAIRRAKEIGGKNGLSCIAELDETAAEAGECVEKAQFPLLPDVPILVKDNIDVKGFHTTAGSLALADNVALSDAPIIRNLRRNGGRLAANCSVIAARDGILFFLPVPGRQQQLRHCPS